MDRQLGIYVHWPYCAAICPYCDFNVYKARGAETAPLLEAIVSDLKQWRAQTGPRHLTSLFFGGGTPSLMDPRDIAQIIELCDDLWGFVEGREISLEANPTDAEAARFSDMALAGVERLSLGLQALDDPSLKTLGRFHSAQEGKAAARLARQTFSRLSIDLIHSRHAQTLSAWEHELTEAMQLEPDHVSPYQLTIESGTAYERAFKRGKLDLPDNAAAADFYTLTNAFLACEGFEAYEVSNHAKGKVNRSRHNLIYWTSQDWLGVGPGASGRLGWGDKRRATRAALRPQDYKNALATQGHALIEDEALDEDAIRDEFWLMGLRLADGLAVADAPGAPLNPDRVRALAMEGYVWQTQGHIGLTAEGRLVADTIIANLLVD